MTNKATVFLFKPSGKFYTEEEWEVPDNAIGPYDMRRSKDFWRVGGALLDALEAKHTQHAETLGYLEHAYEVIEAAQRSPLGYVAMGRPKDSDGSFGMLPARNLATDKLAAEMQCHRFAKDEDMHVILAELREVTE